jgi:hypothetical protein
LVENNEELFLGKGAESRKWIAMEKGKVFSSKIPPFFDGFV